MQPVPGAGFAGFFFITKTNPGKSWQFSFLGRGGGGRRGDYHHNAGRNGGILALLNYVFTLLNIVYDFSNMGIVQVKHLSFGKYRD